jgi:uncharacterized membrane protein YfcA
MHNYVYHWCAFNVCKNVPCKRHRMKETHSTVCVSDFFGTKRFFHFLLAIPDTGIRVSFFIESNAMEILPLEPLQWVALACCAALIGLAKTGLPGAGILAVPLAAMAVPARESVGLVLPMLIFADLFAVGWYRHHAQWPHLFRLLPWTAAGLVLGFGLLYLLDDARLKPVIGVIVLTMLAMRFRDLFGTPHNQDQPHSRVFAPIMGTTAGATTMLANAAGPVMTLYLLAMRLPKHQFIGTSAWFFFAVNWIKVPFYTQQKLITAASLQTDLLLLPVVAGGAVLGILLLNRIPQRLFNTLALLLAAASAIKLILG